MYTSGPHHLATFLDDPRLAGELESRLSHREQAPVLRAEVDTVEAGKRGEVPAQAETAAQHDVAVGYACG